MLIPGAAALQTSVAIFEARCVMRYSAIYLQQIALCATVPKSFAGGSGSGWERKVNYAKTG